MIRQPALRELRRFRRPRRRVRAGLVQLVCVLAGLGLGLPQISAGPTAATTRVTEALINIGPAWDDYLRISLDDLIESAARSPMVLLRARVPLIGLLEAAPPQRHPSIAWRLQHTEDLVAGNFPAIWQDASKDSSPLGR